MERKTARGALIGAAFLMATSAIGPCFLTRTAVFTNSPGSSFGFVILISLLMSAIAQLNIWRVLCYSGLRGQDAANRLVKGLGFALSGLVALGGLTLRPSAVSRICFESHNRQRSAALASLLFVAIDLKNRSDCDLSRESITVNPGKLKAIRGEKKADGAELYRDPSKRRRRR